MYSYLIKDCIIAGADGGEPYKADLGIAGEKIAAIGRLDAEQSEKVIDASGLHLLPGFIDIHSHSDLDMLLAPREINKLSQGVTTEVCGNCGYSLFPVTEQAKPAITAAAASLGKECDFKWNDGSSFFGIAESMSPGFNCLPLVGHGFLRLNAMGFDPSPAEGERLDLMKALLKKELENGCFGFSTGLEYMPGCFAAYDELMELCRLCASFGGVYTTHLRDQGEFLLENIAEAVRLAEETGVSVIISHLKAYGRSNWGKVSAALDLISDARRTGLNVMADFYPYDRSSSNLDLLLPAWLKEGGPAKLAETLSSTSAREDVKKKIGGSMDESLEHTRFCTDAVLGGRSLSGMSIGEAADTAGLDRWDLVFDLILECGTGVQTVSQMVDDSEIDLLAASDLTAVGSDSYAVADIGNFSGHPRNFGTFPRFFRRYVMEKKIVSLSDAVRKTSRTAADFFGLDGRGRIEEGAYADILLIDLDNFTDRASYDQPALQASGLEAVFTNGCIQFAGGEATGRGSGKILRRKNNG